jgi:hypothetical protein
MLQYKPSQAYLLQVEPGTGVDHTLMAKTDTLAVSTGSSFYAEPVKRGRTTLNCMLFVLGMIWAVMGRERGIGERDGEAHLFERSEAVVVVHSALFICSHLLLQLLLSFAFDIFMAVLLFFTFVTRPLPGTG